MTELGPAPFTITEQDLLGKYEEKLLQVIDELDGDVEHERIAQVATAMRNLLYWQAKQYLVPRYDSNNRTIEFAEATDTSGKVKFSSIYNIYAADGVKFVGAVASRAPNAKALPDDDESEQDIEMAKNVDGALRYLRRQWDVNRLQKELAYQSWNTGPTYALTTYVADGHKYGWTEEPVIDVEETDIGMGETVPTPQVKGTRRFPKGSVELSFWNVLYVTHPFKAKKLSDCPWIRLEYMEHKALLKSLYPSLTDEKFDRHDRGGASQLDSLEAQEREASPTSQTPANWSKNKWRITRYWIRPAYYSLIKGEIGREDENGEIETRRICECLEEQYPDGIRVVAVNGKLVEIIHERLDDVWSVFKTGRGERILSEPWGNDLIPIQDDINDLNNFGKEIVLRSIPKTMVSSDLFDPKRLEENDPEVCEYIRVKMNAGMPLANMVHPFPTSRMPDQLMPFAAYQRQMSREIGQVNEALSGGGAPAPTFRGEKIRRDQSMMAFAPWFDESQSGWERTYTNGIRQWAKFGSGEVKVPGEAEKKAAWIDPAMISNEGWHVEAEEGMPMSHADEVDRFLFLLNENNPELPEKLGLLSPYNATNVYKMLGLSGFKAPDELARHKAQIDIQKLLAEPPIPDFDPMTGEPMGMMPSIPADRTVDKPPALYAQIYRDWCLASQETDLVKNPDGYSNVRARLEEYEQWDSELAAQEAMAAAVPPPEAGPGLPPGAVPPEMAVPADGMEPPPPAAPGPPPPPIRYQVIRDGSGKIAAIESDGGEQRRVIRDGDGRMAGIEVMAT